MTKPRLMASLAILIPLAAASWWLSGHDDIPAQLPPRSLAELQSVDDAGLVAEVSSELARRLYATGADPAAWRRLQGPPRHFHVIASLEPEVLRDGLGRFLADAPVALPGPADLAQAYRAIGLAGAAAVVAEAAAGGTGLDARLRQQVAGSAARLTAYARAHLADFTDVR